MNRADIPRFARLALVSAALLATASGCACVCGRCHEPDPEPPATKAVTAQPEPAVHFGAEAAAPNDPGTVNVFGEMKGLVVSPIRAVGDSNYQRHTFLDQGYDADVTVDFSGKYIAYASTRDSDHSNLYLQRVDGNAVTQLTSEAADDAYPAFSPDGKQIAFASTRAGNWQIFVMDATGKNVVQLTTAPTQAIHPSWSPDGTRLVYCALGGKSNQWELWTLNLQTNENRMIGYGLFPSWSPQRDFDRIAFQRPRQRGSRWFSLWTIDLINGEASRATEVAVSSNAALVWPTWSPDGTRIAFASIMEPTRELKPKSRGRTDIWVTRVDGTEHQRLTDGAGANLMPCWAGERIFFISDRGGAECVWSVRADAPKASSVARRKDLLDQQNADTREPEH